MTRGLDWAEVDGYAGAAPVLWLTGNGVEHQIHFQPWEAQELVDQMMSRLAVMPGHGG